MNEKDHAGAAYFELEDVGMRVVVAGGTLAAVEAAVHLAHAGNEVLLAAPGSYFGEDLIGNWRCADADGMRQACRQVQALKACLAPGAELAVDATPAALKRALLLLLREAGVQRVYLTRCLGATVEDGRIDGVLLASKHGVRRVPCDGVVDATAWHTASAALGKRPLSIPKGSRLTVRIEYRDILWTGDTAGQFLQKYGNAEAQLLRGTRDDGQGIVVSEQTLPCDMTPLALREYALAQTLALVRHIAKSDALPGAVLGDALPSVPDVQLGEVGIQAGTLPAGWICLDAKDVASAQVMRWLETHRPSPISHPQEAQGFRALIGGREIDCVEDDRHQVTVDLSALPHKHIPLLVAGTGTAGIWAGIAAAEQDVEVLAIDQQPYPGGTRTVGGMFGLYKGNRNGLFTRLRQQLALFAQENQGMRPGDIRISPVAELLFYANCLFARDNLNFMPACTLCQANTNAHGDAADMLCLSDDGAFVVTPQLTIDATGDGDVAAFLHVPFSLGDDALHATQNFSQWQRCAKEKAAYYAIDQDVMDPTAQQEWTRTLEGNVLHTEAYDLYDMLTVRESRRIASHTPVTMRDAMRGKRTADTIYEGYSSYDPHARSYSLPGRLGVLPALGVERFACLPLGALLPEGVGRLLVVGKAIGVEQDATSYFRMTPDIVCVGYIAGKLAAQSLQEGIPVECLNLRPLQREMQALGAITLPLPDAGVIYETSPHRIAAAILGGQEDAFAQAVLTDYADIPALLHMGQDSASASDWVLAGKTLLWYGDSSLAQPLTELLETLHVREAGALYVDRQGKTGVTKAGILGEIDDYWQINQLLVLLSRAQYMQASGVIKDIIEAAQVGTTWRNNSSPYASIRLDCQTVENYDRLLCIAQAALLMPSQGYCTPLVRLYNRVDAIAIQGASFYKEYLLYQLALALRACGDEDASVLLLRATSSQYKILSEASCE